MSDCERHPGVRSQRDCIQCGAPWCCPACCKEARLMAERDAALSRVAELEAALLAAAREAAHAGE